MNAKILITISARRVTMGLYLGRQLREVRGSANDDAARMAFATLLAAHPRVPVYLMADVVEEDFRSETLPHVTGRARAEMVARKLGQFYRATPYRAAWRQGRAADRRRDDQYLFLALSSPELLRPYLDTIETQRAALAGIYLLPVVSQALIERLKPAVPGVLLVSQQGGGLRQSFFLDGKLRISRLTPFEPSDEQSLDQILADEIGKSRLFLYNSRLLGRDAPLEAWVLDPAGGLHGACAHVPAEAQFRCRTIGGETLRKAIGMGDGQGLLQDMDVAFLCLLGREPPACSLAQAPQTRGFAHLQWRRGLHWFAGGVAAAALIGGVYNLFLYSDYQERATGARREAATLRASYDEQARSFPSAPTSADNMRKAVETVDSLRAQARTPEAAMRVVGKTLAAYPMVQLNKLVWRYGLDRAPGARLQEETELSAEIRPFDGDYRGALRLIENLAQNLRRQPGVADVRVVELPVNLDSKADLSGNTLDSPDAGTSTAQFKLAVSMGRAG
jgi:hypothetical protein